MSKEFKRLPPWLVKKTDLSGHVHRMKARLRKGGLFTVCESARCPNMGECFAKPTATFLIMGNRCTRNCGFCSVEKGRPLPLNPEEPKEVADLAAELSLKHVVITSVTRDDLPDGGAGHFVACAEAIKGRLPDCTIEILTPDFKGVDDAVDIILEAPIDVFNHNLETVPRLYPIVRPGADYERSLNLLKAVKARKPGLLTKSGLMVGLGEGLDEVRAVFRDLVLHGVDAVTVGQYLRPTRENLAVVDYVHPDLFGELTEGAKQAGITYVACAPLVRSSYNAEQMLKNRHS
jgi:lipoic acid synthetase